MVTYTDSLAEGKAQTIVQLLNQLQRQSYQRKDLDSVQRAYETAVSICSCQYRSSGRLLIDHSIGAASILAGLAVDADLVTAGVVHAVYLHGDFGGWRKRLDERKRARIRKAAGGAAEEIVYRYSHSERNPLALAAMRSRGTQIVGMERDLILMRLADLLDIYGEPDTLYCHNADKRRAVAGSAGPEIAAFASELGFPALGAALDRGFATVRNGSIPVALRTPVWKDGIVLPPSYRVPLPIAAYQRARSRIYSLVGR